MGSAFYCEPRYGLSPNEFVTWLMWPSDSQVDLIVHLAHPACALERPHRMSECGHFASAADATDL